MDGGGTAGSRVVFTEVGPRDGFQNLKETLATADKLAVIRGLLATGVDRVEVTSFVSPAWVPQLADAEAVCRALDPAALRDRVRVLVPNRRGLERALAVGARRVLLTIGVTEGFNRRNVNCAVAESLDQLTEIVGLAGDTVEVSLSVAFGCPFEGAVDPTRTAALARACLDAGAAEVGLADTIGVADPAQVRALLAAVVAAGVPLDRVSLHLHDTRGMGLANVTAGWEAGVRRFEGSVGGIGGCPFSPRATGNVCSEDLLHLLARLGAGVAADLQRYCQVATQVAELLGRELPGRLYRAGLWDGRAVSRAPAG